MPSSVASSCLSEEKFFGCCLSKFGKAVYENLHILAALAPSWKIPGVSPELSMTYVTLQKWRRLKRPFLNCSHTNGHRFSETLCGTEMYRVTFARIDKA